MASFGDTLWTLGIGPGVVNEIRRPSGDMALTLIGYALGFLVHLLLKTILHHDALS